jgi:NTP pyrophosphatase (non-canonical NTP hydrolase)
MDKLQGLMNDIVEWSSKTFGSRSGQTNLGVCNHLAKEVGELYDGLFFGDYEEEFADCFMLLLELAKNSGLSAEKLIDLTYKKLEKNKNRKWGEINPDGSIEHIK